MGPEDGERIWRHFKRFAEFVDLKELYNKCVPTIKTMRDDLSEFRLTMMKNNEIIRRFDEVILRKVDKHAIK